MKIGVLINLTKNVEADFAKANELGIKTCQLCCWDLKLMTDETADMITKLSEKFDVEIKFKVSKIVNDENGEMDIEKSEKNKYWDKKIIKKEIEVVNIKSGEISEYELFKLDLTKMHYEYVSKDIYPWLCEVMIINEKKEKIIIF